jgi:UDP-N-acetylmuramyl pentapeptide phosphotransferase/UDP-N-acetylglucosamine-1-phosphate transferase
LGWFWYVFGIYPLDGLAGLVASFAALALALAAIGMGESEPYFTWSTRG